MSNNKRTAAPLSLGSFFFIVAIIIAALVFINLAAEATSHRADASTVVLTSDDGTTETVPMDALPLADQQAVEHGLPIKGDVVRPEPAEAAEPVAEAAPTEPVTAHEIIAHTDEHGVTYTLRACESEDSWENCYWDASERGNGQGLDFIVFNGAVYYQR
jgi:hypothetical protein